MPHRHSRRSQLCAFQFRSLLLVLSLCCGSLQPSRADTPDEQYQFANGLYSQKLWSLATEKLRAFVTEFPNHPRARNAAYQLGGALYRATNNNGQTDYAAVAAAYEFAIAKYPDPKLTPPARFELGDAYFNLGQYAKAISAHRAFLSSNPPTDTAAQAQYWIGESYYALKKPAEARAAYETVLTKYTASPIAAYAQYSLGLLALDAAQYAAAANAFRAVLAKFPNAEVAPESRLHLGDALLGSKQWAAARDAFRAVQQDARAGAWKSDAALGLADAEFGAKNWPAAATAYSQALASLKPDDTRRNTAQFRLGDSLYNDKKYESALNAYAPLLASKDSKVLPNALYWNANTLRALNRHNEAAASYRRLLSEYSNHALAPRAALRLGDTLSEAKDSGGAAEAYRVVLTKYAKSDAAKEAQVALVALAGEVAAAPTTEGANTSAGGASLEQVLRALPPGPATSNAQLQLAQAAFAGGNWARATQLAQSALAGKPNAATAENARYLLASTKLRAGDAPGAVSAFRQQLTQFPTGTLAAQARLGLTWALLDTRKWSEAETSARTALNAPGQNAGAVREQARLALGEALLRNGKAKDALAVFTIAEKSPTKDVATQGVYGAALSLEAQKQWGAAAARWSKLASLSTANDAKARAHLRQGVALAKAKQVASLAAFDKAIAVDPKSELAAQALYESAWAAHDLKQAAQESARWTRLASEYSSSPYAAEASLQRGEALFVMKNWNEAANAYRVVTQNHASSEVAPLAWYKMASAFYNLRNWSEAASAFDKAATFSKSSIAVESNFWAAQSWRQAGGDMNAARARYETFIGAASTPNAASNIKQLLPPARLGLGQTLAASNDWERAVTVYRAGLAGASGGVAAELNYRLGEALSQSGNNKDAATQWLKVVINYPQSEWAARAQWQAAQLLEKTGDRDAAIANYRALSQRQPANEWTAQAQDRLKTLQ